MIVSVHIKLFFKQSFTTLLLKLYVSLPEQSLSMTRCKCVRNLVQRSELFAWVELLYSSFNMNPAAEMGRTAQQEVCQ